MKLREGQPFWGDLDKVPFGKQQYKGCLGVA